MSKISIKLAMYFFTVVMIFQIVLLYYIHSNMVEDYAEDALTQLQKHGTNYRDMLAKNYTSSTLASILLVEQGRDRDVIVLDEHKQLVVASDPKLYEHYSLFLSQVQVEHDRLLLTNWKKEPYIMSAHPYAIDGNKGYLIMIQDTASLQEIANKIGTDFKTISITSIFVLFMAYALLSRRITRPILRMKRATESMSQGDFDVKIPSTTDDELGELGHAINGLAKDLAHMKNSRNEFLSAVSHELRTPLTYLIGYSKVAMREDISEEKRKHYLTIIHEESTRMKALVKNLMDLAQLDEHKFTIEKELIAAKPFIEQVAQIVSHSFAEKGVHLAIDCPHNFTFYADPLRLEQIILNLVDNALKYSEPNATVTLSCRQSASQTRIIVKDTGHGISEEDVGHIFDKFYRVEKSRAREFGGSGIGLAIVKELVEAHGGSITVTSELHVGSQFIVTLEEA